MNNTETITYRQYIETIKKMFKQLPAPPFSSTKLYPDGSIEFGEGPFNPEEAVRLAKYVLALYDNETDIIHDIKR